VREATGPSLPLACAAPMMPAKASIATRPLAISLRFSCSKSAPLEYPAGSNAPPGYMRLTGSVCELRCCSTNAMMNTCVPMMMGSDSGMSLPR